MEKRSATDIGIVVIKTIFSVIFIGFFIYAIYFVLAEKAPLYTMQQVQTIKNWTYYDQLEGPKQIQTPYILDTEGRDTFVFETKLPDSYPEGSVLAFLNLSNVDVTVEGITLFSWDRKSVPIYGSSAKNAYFFVNIPTQYAGSTIRVTRHDNRMKKVLDFYIGQKDAVIRKLEAKNGLPNFVLALFLLVFSFIVFIGAFVLEFVYKKRIPLSAISVGIFVASSWLVFDSFVFEFIFRTKYIDGIMSYICTMGMIFGFIYYLDELQGKRFHKMYFWIGLVELISMITFSILHFTGIRAFNASLIYIDVVIFLGMIPTFVATIVDIVRKDAKDYKITAVGFLLFMILCTIEIITINFVTEPIQGSYLLTGLALLLGFAIAQQFVDIRKIQHERDIANANAEARTQFLANMSHEIRTPINSILGMNEIIIKETTDPQIASYARVASNSGEILLSIINDILDFSKINAGKHEIVTAPYNPKQLVRNLCSILEERAENKGLKTEFNIDDSIPNELYGDLKSITEVLLNLLSNAVKYTEKGTVKMSASAEKVLDNYMLKFVVSDSGIGIKDEDLETVFNPFSRTDLKKNQNIQGTGLGLAITKELVEEMGGTITLESQYGVGSTFTVIIPQRVPTEEELKANPITQEAEGEKAAVEKYRAPFADILVVDDTRANLIVVNAFLKMISVVPDTAMGGYEAVDKCCEKKYDMILMDHMMPECDGIEAMHLIRDKQESLNAETPIIILTANAIKGSADNYKAEGFDDYLSKPVTSDNLIRMIHKYLPESKIEIVEE